MPVVQSILIVVVATLVFGAFTIWTYRPKTSSRAFAPTSVVLGLLFAGMSVVLLGKFVAIPLVLFCTAATCSVLNVAPRFARTSIGMLAVAMGVGYATWFGAVIHQLEEWKQKYPAVDLTERLRYESDVRIPIQSSWERPWSLPNEIKFQDATSFEKLADSEATRLDRHQRGRRDRSLLSLFETHRSIERQFAMATGFGVYRTFELPYQKWVIEIPERPLVPLSHKNSPAFVGTVVERASAGVDYQPWHDENLLDFAAPQTLGYLERANLSKVVGFVPHGFSSNPKPPATSGDAYQPWRITSLSLVSLLKHRPAAAYVSDNLPNMQELTSVPTRSLNAFEQQSLEKLRGGEELAVESDSSQIQMLGAIRAAYQCQECHQVKRGTLLGAFSYQLVRSNAGEKGPADLAEQTSSQ